MKNLMQASVYVGTYGKYNGGSIAGKWLKLSKYESKNEFLQACRRLHKDESDPEFMFQDFENIPDSMVEEEKFFASRIFVKRRISRNLEKQQRDARLLFEKYK